MRIESRKSVPGFGCGALVDESNALIGLVLRAFGRELLVGRAREDASATCVCGVVGCDDKGLCDDQA